VYLHHEAWKGVGEHFYTPLYFPPQLDELETVFSEPLYMCDVKPEHFGLSEHGRMKLLDSDSVHPKSIVGELKCEFMV
jgi:hypothetical protein